MRLSSRGPVCDSARVFRPDIQGLRALAVIMVVAFHAGLPIPGGFSGVDVFFVISGFVVTGMIMREWESQGKFSLQNFFFRRFKRLTPALALTVSLTVILSAFVLSPLGSQQLAGKTGVGAMLLSANVVIASQTSGYFDLAAAANPLLNTWSLSVEEQFYVFFAIMLAASLWLTRIRRLAFAPSFFVAVVAVLSLGAALLNGLGMVGPRTAFLFGFYGPVSRSWEFAAGALLMLASQRIARLPSGLLNAGGLIGMALIVVACFALSESTPYPGMATLLPVVATVLVISAGLRGSTSTSRVLAFPIMVRFGDWSYSIYLWHLPVIVLVAAVFGVHWWTLVPAALLSVPIAVACFRWVEQPLRDRSIRGGWQGARFVALTVLPALIFAFMLVVFANAGFFSASVRAAQRLMAAGHSSPVVSCFREVMPSTLSPEGCVSNPDLEGRPIYLIGDSHADELLEPVVAAGATLGRPVTSVTFSSCPVIDLAIRIPGRSPNWSTECRSYARETLAWLEGAPRGSVIIASGDDPWTLSNVQVGNTDQDLSTSDGARLSLLESGLADSIRQLRSHGQDVLLALPPPRFSNENWTMMQCSLFTWIRSNCRPEQSLAGATAAQAPGLDAMRRSASAAGATLVDLRGELCPHGVCGGTPMPKWRDSVHITSATSSTLAPAYLRILGQGAAK